MYQLGKVLHRRINFCVFIKLYLQEMTDGEDDQYKFLYVRGVNRVKTVIL